MYYLIIICAFLAGLIMSLHGMVNSAGSKMMGLPTMLAFFSIIQALPALIYIMFRPPSIGFVQSLTAGFKWYLISGLIGVTLVTIITLSISNVGALTVFVVVILGQVIGAAVADHFGLFGATVKPINTLKLISICVIIFGVGLLLKADGQSVKEAKQVETTVELNKVS